MFDRRQFIQVSTIGGIGLCLLPARRAEAFVFASLLEPLADFAIGVGSAVVAHLITEYLDKTSNPEHKQQIIATNDSLALQGYSNFSHSVVREKTERIYYPLVYNACDCLHFMAPFFRVECGCIPLTRIEGPHMAGLALAARELRSSDKASALLFPTSGIQEATGNRIAGYDQELRYSTEVGQVAVDYTPKSDRSGIVTVEAGTNTYGGLLYGRDFPIKFGQRA